jgi:predicted DNA-binding protein
MKDSGLRIRVERELREKFLALCREQDKPAAQVIREFMRRYIAENDDGQAALANTKKKKPA